MVQDVIEGNECDWMLVQEKEEIKNYPYEIISYSGLIIGASESKRL